MWNLPKMHSKITALLVFIVFLGLTSCATLPPPAQNQDSSWAQRSKTLSQIQQWHLQGAIGIRTPEDNLSATLTWEQQQNQHYILSLWGPLGTQSFTLKGEPHQVMLTLSDGREWKASSPEALIEQQLHWRLPVSSLYYWIRGLPVPRLLAQKQFDAYHHLTVLNQQGWTIQFLRYASINGIDLPTKITLTYPQLSVKIVITQWQKLN